MKKSTTLLFILLLLVASTAFAQEKKRAVVQIKTNYGKITVELYNETPLHRDNFLKLANEGYFDGTLFHRVIKNFMIQGGDPDSRNAPADSLLGNGGPSYTIPAEIFYPQHFHLRGALAAARLSDQENPTKASSGSQFYIVYGKVFTHEQLDSLEMKRNTSNQQKIFNQLSNEKKKEIELLKSAGKTEQLDSLKQVLIEKSAELAKRNPVFKFTAEQRFIYTTIGGTPHLDGNYTVFGEVLDGIEIVEKIEKVATNPYDRPKKDIVMKVKVKKMY